MSIKSRLIEYGKEGEVFEGILVWDDANGKPVPGVLVIHTIRGRTGFEEGRAEELAKLGYVAFAADVYGKSEIGGDDTATRANMEALKADRIELQRRLQLALAVMSEQGEVDSEVTALTGKSMPTAAQLMHLPIRRPMTRFAALFIMQLRIAGRGSR